uniref:Uncharacterized protein n=1 Tax=viral metagenome TaxID=1070528 RepID=A0A6M3LMH8_9ZZZZ
MSRMEKWETDDYHVKTLLSSSGKRFEQKLAKTLVTSTRYKPSTVATITQYLIQSGELPRSISDVIKLSLECFAEMIVASNPKHLFSDETSAIQYLQIHRLINKGTSGVNLNRVHNNLSMESLCETQNETVVSQSDVNEAMRILNEKLQATPHFDHSIVSPNNKADVSDRVEATHSNQIQQAQVQQVQQVSVDLSSHLVLKADGSTFKVKQDRSKTGRKSVCIVCSKCKRNPSYVLLDFEPNEGQPVLADCCKNCEGVTPHFIVSSISAKNGFEPPTAPTAVPPDEMKRILQAKPEIVD